MKKYRDDIDGIRSYAVIAVILFHLGFLPNGYLGVDVFFVISGYLITSIIYKDLLKEEFSIYKFYQKRIRRIIPLLLFITTTALIIGFFLMLPNDLENLAQSVVASNFSLNNILMLITTSDYWAISNEYKPLMHTWSLGIEEQYYLIYPFLLLVLSKFNIKYLKNLLLFATFVSIFMFIFLGNESQRFFLLHFRFFELSIGGFFAILLYNFNKPNKVNTYLFYLALFLLLLTLIVPFGNNQARVIFSSILTVALLATGKFTYQNNIISKYFLQNRIVVYIGKISFSLYLWHQLIFAFSRYAYIEEVNVYNASLMVILTFTLSIITYHFIENPFRNRNVLTNKKVNIILSIVFLISTSSALYVYFIGGIYKDFPSLNLYKEDLENTKFNFFSKNENIHIQYNEDIRKLDKDFTTNSKAKVLVVGNSFGRDIANIILESPYESNIELKYFDINRAEKDSSLVDRWHKADIVLLAAKNFFGKGWVKNINTIYNQNLDSSELTCFGTKDFGPNNGIHYNKLSSIENYSDYYVSISEEIINIEKELKEEWKQNYISLIKPISNSLGEIRVFTDKGLFISQDTEHLTKAGAKFYADILEKDLEQLLGSLYNHKLE